MVPAGRKTWGLKNSPSSTEDPMRKNWKSATIPGLLFIIYFSFLGQSRTQSLQTTFPAAQQYAMGDDSFLSPRSAAMGGAFVAVADDASALLSNPAGLGFARKGEVALFSDFGWVDTFQETALLGLPIAGYGGVGLAASYLSFGTLGRHDETGGITPNYYAHRISLP